MQVARMLILTVALAAFTAPAPAQESAVKMVVPFPAGATLDVISRLIADRMKTTLGRPVVVENKPGAAGLIAAESVKGAPADGSTLFMATLAIISLNPHTYKALRYDPFVDFTPVAQVAQFQIAFGVAAAVPATTLAEYVALVKKDPKFGFYGTPAAGSLPHFFAIMIGRAAGIELTHVPYKGSAPMFQALAGGEISLGTGTISDLDTLARAGKAKVLAVAGPQRSPQHPEIPTLRESGFDLEGTSWYALYAPARTPQQALDRLSGAAIDAVRSPEISRRLAQMGLEPTGLPAAEMARVARADYERWAPVIRAAGFEHSQ
ncbi:MAG: tripartite tricarboxylate transporter substrate-binding protein [Burkholderiales bacterium]